jgi:hypothetical protein
MPDEKTPSSGAFLPSSLMYFLSGKPMHFTPALTAATMVACSADEIVMGKHSFLGPIDAQLIMQTALGPRLVPAQAILEQFDRALRDAADPVKLRAWAPVPSRSWLEMRVA